MISWFKLRNTRLWLERKKKNWYNSPTRLQSRVRLKLRFFFLLQSFLNIFFILKDTQKARQKRHKRRNRSVLERSKWFYPRNLPNKIPTLWNDETAPAWGCHHRRQGKPILLYYLTIRSLSLTFIILLKLCHSFAPSPLKRCTSS